jgi:cell division protein FtsN
MAKAPRARLRFVDQLVLFVAWVVTCGLVYVLGYYVGKGTPEHHAALEEREVRLPVSAPPPAEGQRPKEAKEFPSFYQALPGGARPIDVARGAAVTAPPATTSTASTTLARATTTVPASGAAAPARPLAPTTTVPARVASTSTTSAPRAAAMVVPSASLPPTTLARAATRGGFTVEANPTRSRPEAEELLASLRKRGYDATLVEVRRDGDTWYRLRVGRYATAEQATETMRRLRDSEGVTHAFIATE